MDGFEISEIGGLRSPVVIMAFSGWSDTGTVTTDTVRRLIDTHHAERFLAVDPEDYYVFTDSRPTVRIGDGNTRELHWPTNEAYAARLNGTAHDLIIVVGAEPNLRWRTFATRFSDAIAQLQPSLICTLVARPAATPHTRPIPITGSSADAELAARFGLGPSRYQGPTGILGVLHDELRKRNCPLISLAAGVPHYLNVEENPPATMALLRGLEPIIGMAPDLGDLDDEGKRFIERVEEASHGDDQIAQYVRTLEEHYGQPQEEPEGEGPEPSQLSADDILRDVEDFLRGSGDS